MGFAPNQRPFNRKQIQIGLTMAAGTISNCIFLIHVADKPKEHMEAIYYVMTSALILISFISTVYKMKIFFIFIDKVQMLIDESQLTDTIFITEIII